MIMRVVVTRGWRTAATALGLLFLVSCVVLVGILTVWYPQDVGPVAQFLGIAFTVTALAVSLVVSLRRATVTTAPTARQLDDARETLAGVVEQRWRQEFLARSLGDPEPMPVCWGLTEAAIMDHSRLIAVDELSFTGRSDRIGALAAEFRRLRRRRLVILGGPGSGKTTLAVQLLRELLATRQPGEPIPVLVSLAGWDPIEQPQLHTWLAARLAEDYPSLSAFGPTTAQALAEQGHLLPILDGLDELPEPRQPEVIAALNTSLTDTDQLVLTCRTTEYTKAVTKAGDVLTSAAVIAPKPLTAAQGAEYLTHCLPPDPGPSWRDLLHQLRTGTLGHLEPAVATPLGLWLLRTVYITPRADPTPLLTPGTTPVQADLFDQLIPRVLTTRSASRQHGDPFRPRRTWDPQDVRSWLTYLADRLHHTGTRDLHWWHLARHTLTPQAVGLAIGLLLVGLPFGLVTVLTFGLTLGPAVGLVGGLTFGLTLALTFGLMVEPTARRWLTDEPAYANLQVTQRVTLLTRRMAFGLVVALVVGLVVGLTVGLVVGLKTGLRGGLAVGLTGGLGLGLMEWVGLPSRTDWATTPRSTYQATRALTVLQLCLAVLVASLTIGLTGWLTADLAIGLVGGLAAGLVAGVVGGLVGGLAARRAGKLVIRSGAWLCYVLVICWLANSGKLPLRLMGFLDDAYRLGLLRTVGPAYQFRHAEFQDHLIRTADMQAALD